jgi:hypothetical protein
MNGKVPMGTITIYGVINDDGVDPEHPECKRAICMDHCAYIYGSLEESNVVRDTFFMLIDELLDRGTSILTTSKRDELERAFRIIIDREPTGSDSIEVSIVP